MDIRTLSDRIVSTDDLLSALGLEQRRSFTRSMATASGWFGAGILVGAGLALMLAPGAAEVRGSVGETGSEGSRPLSQM
jgi:hypothetical protein